MWPRVRATEAKAMFYRLEIRGTAHIIAHLTTGKNDWLAGVNRTRFGVESRSGMAQAYFNKPEGEFQVIKNKL